LKEIRIGSAPTTENFKKAERAGDKGKGGGEVEVVGKKVKNRTGAVLVLEMREVHHKSEV
jgi:hypothetical protein